MQRMNGLTDDEIVARSLSEMRNLRAGLKPLLWVNNLAVYVQVRDTIKALDASIARAETDRIAFARDLRMGEIDMEKRQ